MANIASVKNPSLGEKIKKAFSCKKFLQVPHSCDAENFPFTKTASPAQSKTGKIQHTAEKAFSAIPIKKRAQLSALTSNVKFHSLRIPKYKKFPHQNGNPKFTKNGSPLKPIKKNFPSTAQFLIPNS